MIYGIGIDILAIERIKQSMTKFGGRFEEKIFTPAEIGYCRSKADPAPHFAARFAVKEAVLKALGLGMTGGIAWTDIEVVNHKDTGKPVLSLTGKGHEVFVSLRLKSIHISISHDDVYAIAQAIAEQ